MADELQNNDQAPEEEMFPSGSLDGEHIQPQQVIKKGTPTEVTVSIGKAEVPLKSGPSRSTDRRNADGPPVEGGPSEGGELLSAGCTWWQQRRTGEETLASSVLPRTRTTGNAGR